MKLIRKDNIIGVGVSPKQKRDNFCLCLCLLNHRACIYPSSLPPSRTLFAFNHLIWLNPHSVPSGQEEKVKIRLLNMASCTEKRFKQRIKMRSLLSVKGMMSLKNMLIQICSRLTWQTLTVVSFLLPWLSRELSRLLRVWRRTPYFGGDSPC